MPCMNMKMSFDDVINLGGFIYYKIGCVLNSLLYGLICSF